LRTVKVSTGNRPMLRIFLLRGHAILIHQPTRVVKGIPHYTVFSYFLLELDLFAANANEFLIDERHFGYLLKCKAANKTKYMEANRNSGKFFPKFIQNLKIMCNAD